MNMARSDTRKVPHEHVAPQTSTGLGMHLFNSYTYAMGGALSPRVLRKTAACSRSI